MNTDQWPEHATGSKAARENREAMQKMKSESPRTDAVVFYGRTDYQVVSAAFARQLERELGEAKAQLEIYARNPDRISNTELAMAREQCDLFNKNWGEMILQRDSWRKVADELAKQLAYLNDVERWSYSTKENNHKALAAYNALQGKE